MYGFRLRLVQRAAHKLPKSTEILAILLQWVSTPLQTNSNNINTGRRPWAGELKRP
jgi:hypothetical protein